MIWSFQDKDYNNNNREKVEHQTELPAAPLIVSRETFSKGEWWVTQCFKIYKNKYTIFGNCLKIYFLKVRTKAILFGSLFYSPSAFETVVLLSPK